MRDVQGRERAFSDGCFEQAEDFAVSEVVETSESFIQAEQCGAGGEGAPKSDPFGFATREVFRGAVEQGGDPELVSELIDTIRDIGFPPPLDTWTKGEVFSDGEVGEEDVVLRDEGDSSFAGAKVGDVALVEMDGA